MKKYYEVLIIKTSKAINNKKEKYQTFDKNTKTFKTIKEVKEFLKENYNQCKKAKIYIDDKDNHSQHIGFIYCFKNSDYSHAPVENWYQQDWITVYEIKSTPIIIN